MNYLIVIPLWLGDSMGYVITYGPCIGRYINMTEANALAQFRADFELKGKRLTRI